MIICGIKMTHDAAVAVIDNDRLRFSVELEKISNNPRYSELTDLSQVEDILKTEGLALTDVDRFVVDGWHGSGPHWKGESTLAPRSNGSEVALQVAAYSEMRLKEDILQRRAFAEGLRIGDGNYGYSSYMHVAGHVLGTYCASPFARQDEPAYVLVWDGGTYPRLYFVDPVRRAVENKGQLFLFLGTIYSIMGHYFGPYARTPEQLEEDRRKRDLEGYFGGYSIAGKLMSYIAMGEVIPALLAELPRIHERELEVSNSFEHRYVQAVMAYVKDRGYTDADVLLTLHTYLQQILLDSLKAKIRKDGLPPQNFCFSGGSALNIKWNSAIRQSGLFRATWVPPFPNDAGSAIGAASCEMFLGGITALKWSVYSGPRIIRNDPAPGWTQRPADAAEVARLLHETGQPVVFLHGAAELGPRALGNRSILAPAVDPDMKTTLNRIKRREDFRPVAPLCLEEHAPVIFDPGSPDPYMLFDHLVRPEWAERVPAIRHLDGTARLQTVHRAENPAVHAVLQAYHALSGIPLLCNTSANLNGSGFFPDVASATGWGGTNYVYCDGVLYEKDQAASRV